MKREPQSSQGVEVAQREKKGGARRWIRVLVRRINGGQALTLAEYERAGELLLVLSQGKRPIAWSRSGASERDFNMIQRSVSG